MAFVEIEILHARLGVNQFRRLWRHRHLGTLLRRAGARYGGLSGFSPVLSPFLLLWCFIRHVLRRLLALQQRQQFWLGMHPSQANKRVDAHPVATVTERHAPTLRKD